MKKIIYALTYLIALAIGITLLIFNHQAMEETQPVIRIVMIAIGAIFVIPGLFMLISSLKPHKDSTGAIVTRPWISTVMGIITLIWGILMLCMPGGIFGNLRVSLGVSLAIISLAQIIWIVKGRKENASPIWLYIIPLVTFGLGVAEMFINTDYQTPHHDFVIGAIIAGAAFIIWGVNGFLSLPNRTPKALPAEKATESEKSEKSEKSESSDTSDTSDTSDASDASDASESAEKKSDK